VLFSLAQIIVVFQNVDVMIVNDIVLVNTSIAVIGVVFATVWAGTSHWAQDRSRTVLNVSEPSQVVFHNTSDTSSGGRLDDEGRSTVPPSPLVQFKEEC
jgi:hypothetical protein